MTDGERYVEAIRGARQMREDAVMRIRWTVCICGHGPEWHSKLGCMRRVGPPDPFDGVPAFCDCLIAGTSETWNVE